MIFNPQTMACAAVPPIEQAVASEATRPPDQTPLNDQCGPMSLPTPMHRKSEGRKISAIFL